MSLTAVLSRRSEPTISIRSQAADIWLMKSSAISRAKEWGNMAIIFRNGWLGSPNLKVGATATAEWLRGVIAGYSAAQKGTECVLFVRCQELNPGESAVAVAVKAGPHPAEGIRDSSLVAGFEHQA